MADNNKPSGYGEQVALIMAGTFLSLKVFERFWAWTLLSYRNFALVVAFALLVLMPLMRLVWTKIKKQRDINNFEKRITEKTQDSVFCGTTDKGEDIWIKPNHLHSTYLKTCFENFIYNVSNLFFLNDMWLYNTKRTIS